MKKIIIIFAAMAAVLSSCQKSEIESVSVNDGKDIVLNISVSNPGADDTKALIKEGWEENDQIKIWFDARTGETPDLVIKYDKTNNKWTQNGTAVFIPTSASGNVKAVYSNNVIVTSNDTYTLSGNTLSFKIENWIFLTEIQVVVKGLWSDNASKYTLSCDEFTPLASTGNGYTVGENGITVSPGTKGTATRGIPNKDGIAFVFATADYSSSSSEKKDFEFTIKEEGGIQQTYKPNVAIVAKDGKKSIKALTFANPNYVEIPADYDLNPSTPSTALKWHRQNLAISTSGNMKWKGGNASSAVKVPGSNENVIVGDYFQWGASYPGYSITNVADKKPENRFFVTFGAG